MIKLAYVVQDELVEQETQGSFVGHGWDNILTTTIGKPEHTGSVRGVGGLIGLRDYFGSPQRSNKSLSQEALRKMKQQMEEKMNQHMGIMEQRFMEQLQQQKQIQIALEEKLLSIQITLADVLLCLSMQGQTSNSVVFSL